MKGNDFMKKLSFILCLAIMAVSIAACSSDSDSNRTSDTSSSSVVSASSSSKIEKNSNNKKESANDKNLVNSKSDNPSSNKSNISSANSNTSNSSVQQNGSDTSANSHSSNKPGNTSAAQIEAPVFQESDFNNPVSKAVGKWKLSHYQYDDGTQSNVNVSVEYYIKNNGTFETRVNGHMSSGSYSFDGTNLTLISNASGEGIVLQYDGNSDIIYEQDEEQLAKAIIVRE